MLPEATIQQAKCADIIAIANKHGLKPTRKGQDTYLSLCPFHEDKNPSLSLSPKKSLYHCHACNASGNVIQLVEHLESIGFNEAVKRLLPSTSTTTKPKFSPLSLALLEKYEAEQAANPEFTFTRPELLESLSQAFAHMTQEYQRHDLGKDYLIGERGIKLDPKLTEVGFCNFNFTEKIYTEERRKDRAALKQAGVITKHGTPFFISCIVFPLKDLDGKIISLYGRKCSFTSDSQKDKDNDIGRHYFSTTEHLTKERGIYSIGHSKERVCYITESILDALALYQAGAEQVLALHGVNGYTPLHETYLKKEVFSEIRILLDGDKVGREASTRLSLKLTEQGYSVKILELSDGEDPVSYFAEKKNSLMDFGNPEAAKRKAIEPQDPPTNITRNGDELVVLLGQRTYTIKGLSPAGSDSLKVTIKVTLTTNPSFFFLDKLDLYLARNRQNFVEGLCSKFKSIPNTKGEAIEKELDELIAILENERKTLQTLASNKTDKTVPTLTEADRKEAITHLKRPNILQELLTDMVSLGVIGDEKAKLLCFLGTISRLLSKPLGILILSRSGAGKSTLQDVVMSLVPEESLVSYTRITGQALFYAGEDELKNKVLSIEEEEGIEQARYAIRNLQSAQKLSVSSTRTNPQTGRMKAESYKANGPVAIYMTTTDPNSMDAETKNRFIIMTIDESREQTKRIIDYQKAIEMEDDPFLDEKQDAIRKKWCNMQRSLEPLHVRNPYLKDLEWPFDMLQQRREWKKYTTLLKTIALFHQHQRPRFTEIRNGVKRESIEITLEDIVLANELVNAFFHHSIEELAPHAHSMGLELTKLCKHKGGETRFTRKEVREFTGWSDHSVRQTIAQLLELGYIQKVGGSQGVTHTYELLSDVGEEPRKRPKLTDIEVLKQKLKSKKSGA